MGRSEEGLRGALHRISFVLETKGIGPWLSVQAT